MSDVKWISTDELPEDIFHGYAYMTASTVYWPDGDDVDPIENDGWIDPRYSRTQLFDSRNDVRPAATWSRMDDIEDGETVAESFRRWMRDTIQEWTSAPTDNGDGTVYDDGESTVDGVVWSYALHFSASHHMMRYPNVTEYRVSLADPHNA